MAQIRQGFDTGGATRAHWRAYSLALLAETCGKVGNITEGLTVLAEALTVVEETGIRIYEPEMHRLKGEFLLALDPEKAADAEACFRQAVAIARRHQAKSLELRATMSLARLWQQQGRGNEAHAALAAVYGTYTEGLTTPDLVDATAQLNSLACPTADLSVEAATLRRSPRDVQPRAPHRVSKETSRFLKFATSEAVERSSTSSHEMNSTAIDRDCSTETDRCDHELACKDGFVMRSPPR